MNLSNMLLCGVSVLLTAQSAYSAALTLYAWEDDEKLQKNRVPQTFESPCRRFTLLLPARHEEQVIQDTIQRTVDLNYPRELVQILVRQAGMRFAAYSARPTSLPLVRYCRPDVPA